MPIAGLGRRGGVVVDEDVEGDVEAARRWVSSPRVAVGQVWRVMWGGTSVGEVNSSGLGGGFC